MSEVAQTIGLVGGGQLGRMLTVAARTLGIEVLVAEKAGCPAEEVGAVHIGDDLGDEDVLARLVDRADVVTWEIEHVDVGPLAELQRRGVRVEPSPASLRIIQDKYLQKLHLQEHGFATAEFSLPEDAAGHGWAASELIAKARVGGFDGRGNLDVDGPIAEVAGVFDGRPVFVERRVEFEAELAVVVARDRSGNVTSYPVFRTYQEHGICAAVTYPAGVDAATATAADELARGVVGSFDGAGVFAVEMFLAGGTLLVNEVAPRVHNSGHLTLDAFETSQFEQHVRAVAGLPLGSVRPLHPAAAMVNVLGRAEGPLVLTGLDRAMRDPAVHVHLYGKEPRAGRKIGHVTAVGEDPDDLRTRAASSRQELTI